MESSSTSRQGRKPPTAKQPDIYSTFVVHSNDKEDDEDMYATVVCKDDVIGGSKEDVALPPILKRLSGGPVDTEAEDEADSVSGTMIVRTSRRRPHSAAASSLDRTERIRKSRVEEIGEKGDDEEGNFSTFVMRDSEVESGTVLRRTSKSGGGGEDGGLSTMSRAVASMQAVGEGGIGRQRKSGSGAASEEEMKLQGGKVSSSSFPEGVMREDPFTKYEILHELGKICFLPFCFPYH